ncbi:VgrG protein [Nitrospira tepida]|uniref:VgrG protein n=1 Tax=Nitrospira tepida TaxID=2973512 RepID=A0AA86T8K1_9BACT|nr:phage baseplate assembly protein V [Nitrospira tepida]CAI4033587.1 VgrG protein [Nitrospira tepida]
MKELDSELESTNGVSGKFYGKYRGTVFNNLDPLQLGRIQVMVPDVLGLTPSSWAMPCVPIAGKQEGTFFVPQVGAGVWVEFEQGEPDYPIWVGGFWGVAAEVPALALAPPAPPPGQNIVIQTTGQNTLLLSDVPGPTGGIMLRSTTGAMVLVNDMGITISNGKGASIAMVGPSITITGQPVNLNNGALTIL